MNKNKHVVVLGGGIAGLSSTWKLAEKNIPVKLIEMESYVGGMSASISKGNFILDYGTHVLHSSERGNESVIILIEKLMGKNLITVLRKASIWFFGKRMSYPLSPKEILLNLNPVISIIALLDFVLKYFFFKLKISKEDNLEDWIVNRFGRTLYNIYFGPYTKKTWGYNPSDISPKWALQRIPLINMWELFKRTFLRIPVDPSHEHPHSPYRRAFYYTDKGSGLIMDTIASEIKKLGGQILLDSKVVGVKTVNDEIRSVIIEKDGKREEIECTHVISTIPINNLIKKVFPSLDHNALKAVQSLRFRSAILFYIIVNKERVFDDQWIYFPDPKIVFNRISEFKNLTKKLCPNGKTSLCIEITCFENDNMWNVSDDELFTKCIEPLEELKLLFRYDVEDYFTHRLPWAYPIWGLDYEDKLDIVTRSLKKISNLSIAGRQGEFKYLNMDQCIVAGFNAARHIESL